MGVCSSSERQLAQSELPLLSCACRCHRICCTAFAAQANKSNVGTVLTALAVGVRENDLALVQRELGECPELVQQCNVIAPAARQC